MDRSRADYVHIDSLSSVSISPISLISVLLIFCVWWYEIIISRPPMQILMYTKGCYETLSAKASAVCILAVLLSREFLGGMTQHHNYPQKT